MLKPEQKSKEQITPNFKLGELEFYDKIPDELKHLSVKLLQNLQIIRDYFGKPITIISGYRAPARNAAVGGKSKSLHLQAAACDIQVKGVEPNIVYSAVDKMMKEGKIWNGGLGVYPTFCHYDVRGPETGHSKGARWQETGSGD